MAKVVSFIIQKGGCGKTTTTVNTAGYLSEAGFRVLAVDMDPQGNLTQHLGYDNESVPFSLVDLLQQKAAFDEVALKRSPNLHIIPNNLAAANAELSLYHSLSREFLLRDILSPLMQSYDYILIDCPPTLGLYSLNALAASTEFVLVVAPEFFPMRAIKPLYETFRMVKEKLNHSLEFNGVLMTMCDFRTRHSQEVYDILKNNFPHKLYNAYIRNNVSLKEAASVGKTIFEHNSQAIGAFDYRNFAEEFMRDHHKSRKKRQYYQHKFETLPANEKEQVLLFSKRNMSDFTRSLLNNGSGSPAIRQALLVERNRILEKLFPYRAELKAEETG
ncbi:MAG: ParA family protein [Calditrichia bacterium]